MKKVSAYREQVRAECDRLVKGRGGAHGRPTGNVLEGAASRAPTVALELEAIGKDASTELVAVTIAAALLNEVEDQERVEKSTIKLLPHVGRNMADPTVQE